MVVDADLSSSSAKPSPIAPRPVSKPNTNCPSRPRYRKLLRERPPAGSRITTRCFCNRWAKRSPTATKIQGSKISRWDYGQFNELRIVHPVLGQLPLIGKYFNIGPVPMSGSSTTIKQTTRRLGPSMRMVVDLSDLDHSMQNITIGESGQALSRHYKDQWSAYYGATKLPDAVQPRGREKACLRFVRNSRTPP